MLAHDRGVRAAWALTVLLSTALITTILTNPDVTKEILAVVGIALARLPAIRFHSFPWGRERDNEMPIDFTAANAALSTAESAVTNLNTVAVPDDVSADQASLDALTAGLGTITSEINAVAAKFTAAAPAPPAQTGETAAN